MKRAIKVRAKPGTRKLIDRNVRRWQREHAFLAVRFEFEPFNGIRGLEKIRC